MSKLDERRKQYDIPDVPYLPQGKKVIVFRIPTRTKTEGGLIIPETHRDEERRGVLLAAGLKARDVMRDALIEIGDIVWLPRFVTDTPEVSRNAEEVGKHIVMINVEDIPGSVDGLERLAQSYSIECFDTDDGPEHRYVKAVDPEPKALKTRRAS